MKQTSKKQPAAAIDPVALTHALSNAAERAIPIFENYIKVQGADAGLKSMEPLMVLQERFTTFLAVLAANPRRMIELQFEYWGQWANIWQNTFQKFSGQETEDLYKPEAGDRRFRSEDWNENILFDFIKQSYLMTSNWMHRVVRSTENIDKATLEQIDFYTGQIADALSPTNFVLTNPDVLRETVRTGGENLVNGLENLIEDMERGNGALKISTTNSESFKLGENLASTKGAVVHQNDLMQLIQYEPTTDKVFKTPIMIIPPWINKYYILDMRPENSYVKWLVDQGHTVFMVSWVNPTADQAHKDFADYMREGILETVQKIKTITQEKSVNLIAYCIGGTLAAMALSWMKKKGMGGDINSVTFLTTLIDFENAGDLKLFTDEKQISAMEKTMKDDGVLSGDHLQKTFALLRANDMIWSFVINNYLMGREPFPFDLLYWNEDSTNMPSAMHSYYLRNMYLNNKLIEPNGLEIEGIKIDIRDIKTPAYFLSAREDHIAPWKATYSGYHAFTGPKKFTLSGSGHIGGVVNPPAANKYRYWTSEENTPSPDQWISDAKECAGSWWSDWQQWVLDYAGDKGAPREIKNPIEPAPGKYVKRSV